ncbi:MAG: helix-turn-helix domain-containing protein [Mesorhizobium sp.]|nr:DNA-binding protein [Mesorhizobium sp.]MBL8577695.1 helix-turn-helix domain-containing protein [Mesorhizobium sp.]
MTTITKGAYSLREFQQWAGIGRTKTLNEISAGRLHAVKAGRKVLIPASAAQAWLDALRIRPLTEITLED